MRRIVGLSGKSGSGKDVVATHLVERHGFVRVAIADHLKLVARVAFALDEDQLWGARRNENDPRYGRTPRQLYQALGDALNSIAPNVLLRTLEARIATLSPQDVVVSDLRLPSEVTSIRALGGRVWRIERPGRETLGAADDHHTERALDATDVDSVLVNDGTVAELAESANTLLSAASGEVDRSILGQTP